MDLSVHLKFKILDSSRDSLDTFLSRIHLHNKEPIYNEYNVKRTDSSLKVIIKSNYSPKKLLSYNYRSRMFDKVARLKLSVLLNFNCFDKAVLEKTKHLLLIVNKSCLKWSLHSSNINTIQPTDSLKSTESLHLYNLTLLLPEP